MIKNTFLGACCKAFLALTVLLQSAQGLAQERSACARTLELAKSVYQKGDLQEIPELLEECLSGRDKGERFTKAERLEALKILALSYLYREEPEKADSAMLSLLRTNSFFEVDEAIDPPEFISLYRTFRTTPLFSVGFKLGGHALLPSINQVFYSAGADIARSEGVYMPAAGFQVGAAVKVDLIGARTNKRTKWSALAEFSYVNSNINYSNQALTRNEETRLPGASLNALLNQQRLMFSPILIYRPLRPSRVTPYIGVGFGFQYLISASAQLETQTFSTNNIINGPPLDIKDNMKPFLADAVGLIGVEYKIGGITIQADIRYQHGLSSAVGSTTRVNLMAALDYGLTISDFSQNSVMLNVGVLIPYFSPKKILK